MVRQWPALRRAGPAVLAGAGLVLAGITGCQANGASAAGRAVPRSVSKADINWLDAAHRADMAEIAAGQLAADKGGSAAIRSAGTMLVHDHSALDRQLVTKATALHVQLPTHLLLAQTQAGDRLQQETGPAFDHDFTAVMMSGHQAMIAQTRQEIAHGSSPVVRSLARKTLPVLIKHLRALQRAAPTG